jgi:hypothetical protein
MTLEDILPALATTMCSSLALIYHTPTPSTIFYRRSFAQLHCTVGRKDVRWKGGIGFLLWFFSGYFSFSFVSTIF